LIASGLPTRRPVIAQAMRKILERFEQDGRDG
jgi:hypothetical protein